MLSPNGRVVDVYQPDNSHSIIDVFLVLSIDLSAPIEPPQNATNNGT